MGKYIDDLMDIILDKLNIEDKEEFVYKFRKYNFIVVFGLSFCVYLVIFSIQSIFGKKDTDTQTDFVVQEEQQTTVEVEPTQDQVSNNIADVTTNANNQVTTGVNGVTIASTIDNTANTNQQITETTQPTTASYVFATVDESYLNGALFIGDSRTVALQMYSGLNNTNFFVNTGMSIWKVMDSQIANVNGQTMTVDKALQSAKYDKIYIMLGINEVGTGTPDTFLQQYANVVNRIKQLQPQAIIYIQSIMHVTQSKDDANTAVNNNNINARNEKLKTLADNVNVFWLDENEVFDLEGTGKLNPQYTSDGVHLKANYIKLWVSYLLSHAVVR